MLGSENLSDLAREAFAGICIFKKVALTTNETMLKAPDPGTALQKRRFLTVLASSAFMTETLEVCGLDKKTVYQWREEDGKFAADWDRTMRDGVTSHLEAEAVRRALAGSDLLLMFLLKAADRKRYDDNVARNAQDKQGITITMVDATGEHVAGPPVADGGIARPTPTS